MATQNTAAIPPKGTIIFPQIFRHHPELWSAIGSGLHSKSFHKHETAIHHSDPAGFLWVVASGWLKLVRQTPDGKESVIGLCTEGDIFGEAALFAHANYPYNAEIISEHAELIAIPSAVVRKAIAQTPSLSEEIMSLLNERSTQAQLQLEHMSTMTAAQRLGCFLLRLCHSQHSGQKTLLIPVEKHILAAYLGMKPETLSRSQKQLADVGVSVRGHDVTVQSIESLRHYVCSSCSESGSGACEGQD